MSGYQTYEFKEKYKGIDHTMFWLVEQAKAGIDYCKVKFPQFDNPYQMFYYLKRFLTFKNDPAGVELLQSPGTLFEDNFHGWSGSGDCDCFSILLLSCIWANGWSGAQIVLSGRSTKYPSHIYIIMMWEGRPIVMDLTEPEPNVERIYPYKQILKTI